MIKKKLLTTLSVLALSTTLYAQKTDASFAVEIDPSTYLFSGYSLHLKKSFASLSHWQFGLGLYAMDFPKILVDMNPHNKDEGWNQRLEHGYGLFADYYFDKKKSGTFVGMQLAHQKYKITKNAKDVTYNTFLTMLHLGYNYSFFENFYLKPWIGIGYNNKISGSSSIDGEEFDIAKLVVFPTVHLGYNF